MSAVEKTVPRYVLPGSWGRLDLSSAQSTKESIRRLVEQAAGKSDQLATMRHELRNRFQVAADEARSGGAIEMQIAQEIAPGIPLAATLAVFLPEIDLSQLEKMGLAELEVILTGAVADDSSSSEVVSTEELRLPELRAVRQTYLRRTRMEGVDDVLRMLQADYWIAAANPARLALLSFSSTFVEFEEQILELFDAITATTQWPVGDAKTSG